MEPALDHSAQRAPAIMPRLVLIEDDESVRRSMTMLLRARGFQIDTYRSGTEFLMSPGGHGCDCLLIDYKMPRVDGLEVMRRVRARDDVTPAIMITGYYSETLRNKALTAGFSDVLEKPTNPGALIQMIEQTLN